MINIREYVIDLDISNGDSKRMNCPICNGIKHSLLQIIWARSCGIVTRLRVALVVAVRLDYLLMISRILYKKEKMIYLLYYLSMLCLIKIDGRQTPSALNGV